MEQQRLVGIVVLLLVVLFGLGIVLRLGLQHGRRLWIVRLQHGRRRLNCCLRLHQPGSSGLVLFWDVAVLKAAHPTCVAFA